MKKVLLAFIILILMVSSIGCIKNHYNKLYPLNISFIDVGQGDSILIQYKNKNILIDSGPDYSEKHLIKYLKDKRIKKLDMVIATHPHADHIGGMDGIIKSFKIKSFQAPKVLSSDESFVNMVKALRDKNISINTIKKGKSIALDKEAQINFLSPSEASYDNINNYSAVALLTYKNTTYLFTGDAEEAIENELISDYPKLKVDLIKLGHHGSKTSSTDSFLRALAPKITVISCGLGNDYNHPSPIILDRLRKLNIKVLRTDTMGTITIISNGKDIIIP
ncbi:ComEC/Rec2 family competence protein [Alloiococcus sp. CFN-8]|uniref:ComEC/Rec2 family competence protein n=1 Tax=Alloiococcus sp. CFN-8 TaxID=3416081 RepID=UPI003CF3FEE9